MDAGRDAAVAQPIDSGLDAATSDADVGTDGGPTDAGGVQDAGDAASPGTPFTYESESGFMAGAAHLASSVLGASGTGYVTGFSSDGAQLFVTVFVDSAGSYMVSTRYSTTQAQASELTSYVNGIQVGTARFAATATESDWAVHDEHRELRPGLNTIAYRREAGNNGDVNIDAVLVLDGRAFADRGASSLTVALEAEDLERQGMVVGPGREYGSVEAEASARQAVRLEATGDFIEFTLEQPANALVVRYSIPDSDDGRGDDAALALYANGMVVHDIPLSSKYAWVYGAYPYSNQPSDGQPHRYFDEQHVLLDESLPAGTVMRLQKDANASATSITVDLIELEQVDPPYPMPAGFVSLASFGAVADDDLDDAQALRDAISAARDQQTGVFIPPGTFDLGDHLYLSDVTLAGAGPWHSTLRGRDGLGGLFGQGGRIQILDLMIAGDVSYRDDANFHTAVEGNFGAGSLVQDVWIEHTKAGIWIDAPTDGLYVVDTRIRNTFADGVNLHRGTRHTRVDQSRIRGTGDDGLAMWSEAEAVQRCAYTHNTVQLPMLANGIAIYGGADNSASDNLIADTVYVSAGIAVSTRFNSVPFSGTTAIERNRLLRTGGYADWNAELGALWILADSSDITTPVVVRDVDIIDSSYQGVFMSYQRTINQLSFERVQIIDSQSYGIDINANGSASFTDVTVIGSGGAALNNPTGYTVTRVSGNTGF